MSRRVVLGLVLAAAACGDNQHAAVDAAPPPVVDAAPPSPNAIVVAGGMFDELGIGALAVSSPNVPHDILGTSPLARRIDGQLAVVDRDGQGAVSLVAPTAEVAFQSMFANAQDVALVGSVMYVPQNSGVVGYADSAGSASGSVTLAGSPVCTSAIAVGTDVYVACSVTGAPAEVFVLDSTTNTVRTSFALGDANVTSLFEPIGDGTIAIAISDGSGGGCVEQITPGAVPTTQCIVRNVLLGGDATRLQFQPLEGSTFLWMAVAGTGSNAGLQQLMAYDISAGETWPPISTAGEQIGDVALCPDGTLVLSEVTPGASGLRVYQLATEVTKSPLAIGQPPTSPHGIECY